MLSKFRSHVRHNVVADIARWRIAGAFVALSAVAALAALGASSLSAAPAPGSLATFTVDRSDPNNPVNKYTWTVPKGMKAVTFDVVGASGGSRYRPSGGIGGEAKGTFSVTPGTVFEIVVGGEGGVGCPDGCPGLNGGGPSGADVGGADSGSGGGGSDVRAGSCAASLSCTFADRIVVGGGGGGDAVWNGDFIPNQNCYPIWTAYGGDGGDTNGTSGDLARPVISPCHFFGPPPDNNPVDGGSQTDPGPGGLFGRGAGYGGGDGGGGGGGWFGGGSGQYSGGGGGSGYVDPLASSASLRTGIALGDGQVVISDATPPTSTAPVQSLVAGNQVGTTTVPVRFDWTAADNLTPPASIQSTLQQRIKPSSTWSAYSDLVGPTLAKTATASLPADAILRQLRISVQDGDGNVGTGPAGPMFRVTPYQESSSAIAYSGTWQPMSKSGAFGGGVRYSTQAGAKATLTSTGRNLAVVMPLTSTGGTAKICLDPGTAGQSCSAVDLSPGSGLGPRKEVFVRNGLSASVNHKVQVTVITGRVDLDAFVALR